MVFANNTQRETSEVRRLPRKMTMGVSSAAPAIKKRNLSCENIAKVLRLPHKTTFEYF
jgi:hypothetical protein